MEEIEKRIDLCLKDLVNPGIAQEDRSVLTSELSAYGSLQLNSSIKNLSGQLELLRKEWRDSSAAQSTHTKSLVWWSRALVLITAVYAVFFLIDVAQKWLSS